MFNQRSMLPRISGLPGAILKPSNSAFSALLNNPFRSKRTVARFQDGSKIEIAYDEQTLEVQAIIASSISPTGATVFATSAPNTTYSLGAGFGDRETALPATEANKLKAQRIQGTPRWLGLGIRTAGE